MPTATSTHDRFRPKFVGELPAIIRTAPKPKAPKEQTWVEKTLESLRKRPGQWAEVAYYPAERATAATVRGNGIHRRHPDIEYTTRKNGKTVTLYLRAVEKPAEVDAVEVAY